MNDNLLDDMLLDKPSSFPETTGFSEQNGQPAPEPCMEFIELGSDAYRPEHSKIYDNPYDLIPESTDIADELIIKAQRVSDVIEEGASLALTTHKMLTANGGRTPEQIACSIMTTVEHGLFEAWKAGLPLPPIDFDNSRKPSISSGKDIKVRLVRGQAMQRVYNRSNLDEEHYLWFASSYNFLMPLISAVTKLIKAERNVNQCDATITQLDLEECQTINKLVAAFASRQEKLPKYRIRFLNRAIHRAITLATTRKTAIHSFCPNAIENTVVTNEAQPELLADAKQSVKHEYYKLEDQDLLGSSCSKK